MLEDFEAPAKPEAKDIPMPKAPTPADKRPFEEWHKEKAPEWVPALSVQIHADWPGAGFEVTEAEYDAALKGLLKTTIGYGKGGAR